MLKFCQDIYFRMWNLTHSRQQGKEAINVRLLSKLAEAHWCIAAWDGKNGRSCFCGCSCSLPQKTEPCKPGATAVERTTEEVKLLVIHGKRKRETEELLEQFLDGFHLCKGEKTKEKKKRQFRIWIKQIVFSPSLGFPLPFQDASIKESHQSRLIRLFLALALLRSSLSTDPNGPGVKFSLCPSWSVCNKWL